MQKSYPVQVKGLSLPLNFQRVCCYLFGHVIAGVALDFIAFPENAVPGEIPEDTIFNLGLVDGPFAMIWGLIAVFFYARYKITKEYHAKIKEQLGIKNS